VAHVVTGSFHSSSHNLLQWFNWLPVEYHVNFRISNITFHTLYSSQPAYQLSALCARHSTCCLRLSHTNLFSIPYVRTSFGARSFNVAAPAIWNSLPSALYMCTSPHIFCHHLKGPLFPAGIPTHLSPSSCTSYSASADRCAHLKIIFPYLLYLLLLVFKKFYCIGFIFFK